MKKIFPVLLLLFATSCPLSLFAQDYIIGSQDLLKITVYEHPDLTTETRVSEDGKISFPLIGELDIKNLTARQVEKKIAEKLSGGYITNPQVAVLIQQYMGQRVTIIGEVSKPGQYEITGPTYVLDIISKALGTTQNAGYIITLFRKGAGANPKLEKFQIDLDRLLRKGELEENIQMKDKDIIFVPKGFFYVYGEVNRPGAYRIEKGLTVKRAVALAGGFNQKAAKKKVEITRRTNDKDVIRDGTLDDTIEIDDVIMVRESLF